jgi:FdhD protein
MDPIHRVGTERWEGSTRSRSTDPLVVEEPLEIRLAGEPIAVTMRTPGHDLDLAAGFLFTEGILSSPDQVGAIAHCSDPQDSRASNIVEVVPARGRTLPERGWQRAFYVTSSCGVCGKASIDAVRRSVRPLEEAPTLQAAMLYRLPEELRRAQVLFSETGALHGAALFTLSGELKQVREDVGRHNAVDKVVGSCFLAESLPLRGHLLLVSGRASFEIVQKALMAGIPVVAAVSGVSTLAVELAREAGMLLVGFLRGRSMQVYSGSDRLS